MHYDFGLDAFGVGVVSDLACVDVPLLYRAMKRSIMGSIYVWCWYVIRLCMPNPPLPLGPRSVMHILI